MLLLLVATGAAADEAAFRWQNAGAETYAANCGTCHQPNGEGVPDTFPALTGHAPMILSRPGGRDYLMRLVLFGLEGSITANGKPFSGAMPPMGEVLSNEELAGALDFALFSWDNDKALPPGFQPFTPADIEAARGAAMASDQVFVLREQIMPATPAPDTPLSPPSFTLEQADRGQAVYRKNCQNCHGANLNDGNFGGPPLNGPFFARHWGNGTVAALFGFMSARMPSDRPGRLTPRSYADLTAFLLRKNGYPSTAIELPPDPESQQQMSLKR